MAPVVLLSESFLHRLDPVILPIAGDFAVRWYGMSYLLGFLIGWLIVKWMGRTGRIALSGRQVDDLILYSVVGVIVGGRLGYVLLYQPSLMWDPPILGILQVWRGGMASHGGMAGVILAMVIFAWRTKIPKLHLLDIVAFICPPGLGLGRVANFINGELWGEPLPASMQSSPPFWSIKYPEEILLWADPGRLAQLEPVRDALGEGPGTLQQIVDAARAGNDAVIAQLQPLLTAYYPSQVFQALAEGLILMAVLVIVWLKPRTPGVIGSVFFIAYGILRILTEHFRQPDEGVAMLDVGIYELSRGQVLSALMVLVGLVALALVARREVEPMGGLAKGRPPTSAGA